MSIAMWTSVKFAGGSSFVWKMMTLICCLKSNEDLNFCLASAYLKLLLLRLCIRHSRVRQQGHGNPSSKHQARMSDGHVEEQWVSVLPQHFVIAKESESTSAV